MSHMPNILRHFMKATVSVQEIDQMITRFRDQGWELLEIHSNRYRQIIGFRFHKIHAEPF